MRSQRVIGHHRQRRPIVDVVFEVVVVAEALTADVNAGRIQVDEDQPPSEAQELDRKAAATG